MLYFAFTLGIYAQQIDKKVNKNKTDKKYKKRVLETVELDLLSSYYEQDGDNAAVSGGIGTEEIQDATSTIIVSIPLNDDDILVIDAGISAYTSASSSNVNPFDRRNTEADAFVASSGESQSDVWSSFSAAYSHSSDDRNKIWSGNLSFSTEYDYTSIGAGASFTRLLNEKNTELSFRASAFFDQWSLLYPAELRSFGLRGEEDEDENFDISKYQITGNPNYSPEVTPLLGNKRNSYAVGLGFSQILSKKLQASLAMDIIMQQGQLSTPFQRVYFQDIEDSFIENFHLADDIERLPDSRIKFALGGRLNYYINEYLALRSFYRFYKDDWNLSSHTTSLELPIKIMMGQFTFYPSYRFYNQTAIKYFAPYNEHQSTSEFYTSDFDLSKYHSHQLGFGVSYNNIYGTAKLWKLELKGVDIKFYKYDRNSTFRSYLVTAGFKFRL